MKLTKYCKLVKITIKDAKSKHNNSYIQNSTNAVQAVWKIVKNITARDQDKPFRSQDLDLEPDDIIERLNTVKRTIYNHVQAFN